MSTIKSSTEHLTLNADGSGKDIKFQANGVEKASISSAGAFTSTSIDATKLSGALPAIDGSALTGTFGAGQTWQAMASSRAAATTYTNSTGRPISVSIRGSVNSTAVSDLTLTVGSQIAWTRYTGTYTGNFNITAVIPTGHSYYMDMPTGTTFDRWEELR